MSGSSSTIRTFIGKCGSFQTVPGDRRKFDRKAASLARRARDSNGAAVRVDNVLHQSKAKTCSLTVVYQTCTDPVKLVEDALLFRGWNPDPLIGDIDQNLIGL